MVGIVTHVDGSGNVHYVHGNTSGDSVRHQSRPLTDIYIRGYVVMFPYQEMKKLIITIMLMIAVVITTATPALAGTITEPVECANLAHQNYDGIREKEDNTLAPLWSFLSEAGKSIAGMWVSIIILIISGTGFLIVYLRRKSYAVRYDDDSEK